jgi:hypothetical protein
MIGWPRLMIVSDCDIVIDAMEILDHQLIRGDRNDSHSLAE